MQRNVIAGLVAIALAIPAFAADEKPAAGQPAQGAAMGNMDMTKMGPMSRMPKEEKKDKQELDAFFKAWMQAHEKADMDAVAAMVDFPVMMMTDTSKGEFKMENMDKDKWMSMMKPMMEHMKEMKGPKPTHKGQCFMMSDDLASCEGSMTMAMGGKKMTTNHQMIMTRKDGKWMTKSMMAAGWGDMPQAGTGGAGQQ